MVIKLFEMFVGYGGGSFALEKAQINYKCVGYSETDKYAIKCYKQNFPNRINFGDCRNIKPEELPDFDLLTAGFPCQDVSIAGKRDLSQGRTYLINDVFRIAKNKQPKYIVLENVKGLLSMKGFFKSIIYTLRLLGYNVLYKVLNTKDYGIPQNRQRIWIIAKKGEWEFMEFEFPKKEKLKIFVKDILESEVNKKYYLSELMQKKFCEYLKKGYNVKKVANCLDANMWKGTNAKMYFEKSRRNVVYERETFNKGGLFFRETKNCPTLRERMGTGGNNVPMIEKNGKLRSLTPAECFKLMGFFNDEINIKKIKDMELYKLAGNGWDINLVSKIFKNLFKNEIIKDKKEYHKIIGKNKAIINNKWLEEW